MEKIAPLRICESGGILLFRTTETKKRKTIIKEEKKDANGILLMVKSRTSNVGWLHLVIIVVVGYVFVGLLSVETQASASKSPPVDEPREVFLVPVRC